MYFGPFAGVIHGGGRRGKGRGFEHAKFPGLQIFLAFGHGQALIEGGEGWYQGHSDLDSPDGIELVVLSGFQRFAEAAEDNEGDNRASEGSLIAKGVSYFHTLCLGCSSFH